MLTVQCAFNYMYLTTAIESLL